VINKLITAEGEKGSEISLLVDKNMPIMQKTPQSLLIKGKLRKCNDYNEQVVIR
jgi:hypothetical protein